jgi:hypothetical protein
MMEPEELSEQDARVTNLTRSEVPSVQAAAVRMHQSVAETIAAQEVALHQSAAASVTADSVSAHQSGLAMVEAEEFLSQHNAIGFVQAEKASVRGYTAAVMAGSAEVHYGLTGVAIGRELHVEGARAVLLVGRNVHGNVNTLMDSRSALIAGLTGGLFAGLLLLLGRTLFGRR